MIAKCMLEVQSKQPLMGMGSWPGPKDQQNKTGHLHLALRNSIALKRAIKFFVVFIR